MNKTNFDRLLKRYITGQVSEHEKVKIETWLDVVKTENASDMELNKEDQERLFQKIVSNNDNLEEIRAMVPRNKITILGWTLRIAATALVIALVSYAGWQLGKRNNGAVEIASSGPVEKVILPDGSLVWLKGSSKLVYYVKEEENVRYAELNGEALFEVAKNASHPFVINCGNTKLKVLGTSFSVKTNGDSLELRVLTGKVNVLVNDNKKSMDVLPDEKVVFATGLMEKFSFDNSDAVNATLGTEYNLQFANESLDQVVNQLEKKFDVNITIENRKAASCSITVDLTDQSLEHAMDMITEVLDVDYSRHEGLITISGQGCK